MLRFFAVADTTLKSEVSATSAFIISFIKNNAGLHVPSISVDTARDRKEIYDLMELRKQNNSFAQICPDLINEWNYEKNGSMFPEDVTPFR